MGVEVKGAGDGVVIADRGCNDCNYGRNNSGWGSEEWSTGNQVPHREHCQRPGDCSP